VIELVKHDQRSLGSRRAAAARKQSVAPSQLGAAGFAPQNPHFVAKDEDLDFPVALVAGGRQTKDGAQHHVEE